MRGGIRHDLAIVVPDIGRTRKTPEIGRRRLLRSRQTGHVAQIRRNRVGQMWRHHRAADRHRLRFITVDRQRERARTPGRAVLLLDQRREQRFSGSQVVRNRQTDRVAQRRFLVDPARQRHLIPALRLAVVAQQIVSEPTIERERGEIGIGAFCGIEILHRIGRLVGLDQRRSDLDLDPPIARRNLVGAVVETQRGLRIAHAQRGLPRIDQRRHIARIARQPRQRGVQFSRWPARDLRNPRRGRAFVDVVLLLLRGGRRRRCRKRQYRERRHQSARSPPGAAFGSDIVHDQGHNAIAFEPLLERYLQQGTIDCFDGPGSAGC